MLSARTNRTKIYIELMLFDLDGTLLDSSEDIVNAVNYTLERLGLKRKGFEEIVSYIGSGVEELLLKSVGEGHIESFTEALDIFKNYYPAHSAEKTRPYPGVPETLEYFGEKDKVVVTNRTRGIAEGALREFGISGYFKDIIGADDLSCKKPTACPLNRIIDKFKVDRRRCIMIGDMDIDVRAGREADVYTCGVTYGIGRREDILKAAPDFIIDDIRELREIVI